MGRKVYLTIIAVLLFVSISIPPAAFAAENTDPATSISAPEANKQINLTDAQKSELKQLYDKMFELKKQTIQKYLDFGVISKEQADKKLKKIEDRQKKIEQNGFTPKYGKEFKGHGKDRNGKNPKSGD